jgi:hypothetical protein
MYSAIIKDSEHMKPPTAAAAAKRKQSERRSPEELPELQHDIGHLVHILALGIICTVKVHI